MNLSTSSRVDSSFDQDAVLKFYSTPGPLTDAGHLHHELSGVPETLTDMCQLIQETTLHHRVAQRFYNYTPPPEREEETFIRTFSGLLDFLKKDAPEGKIFHSRAPERRLLGVCHHFNKLLIGFLRAKGIPARMRFVFATYFHPGFYQDHAIVEYWDALSKSWKLADPQFDEVWLKNFRIQHPIIDVPRHKMLTASEAWQRCRNGGADPQRFGIFKPEVRGMYLIAGNLMKDLAALNKWEMLPWDAWGAMPNVGFTPDDSRTELFDMVADALSDPDRNDDAIKKLYEHGDLSVPMMVLNCQNQRVERVLP